MKTVYPILLSLLLWACSKDSPNKIAKQAEGTYNVTVYKVDGNTATYLTNQSLFIENTGKKELKILGQELHYESQEHIYYVFSGIDNSTERYMLKFYPENDSIIYQEFNIAVSAWTMEYRGRK